MVGGRGLCKREAWASRPMLSGIGLHLIAAAAHHLVSARARRRQSSHVSELTIVGLQRVDTGRTKQKHKHTDDSEAVRIRAIIGRGNSFAHRPYECMSDATPESEVASRLPRPESLWR